MSTEVIAVLGFFAACGGLALLYAAIEKLLSLRAGGRDFETPEDAVNERYLPSTGGDSGAPHAGA